MNSKSAKKLSGTIADIKSILEYGKAKRIIVSLQEAKEIIELWEKHGACRWRKK